MRKRKQAIRLCILLLCLNLAFIWGNSLLRGEYSQAISEFVGWVIELFFPSEGELVQGESHGTLRKIAHLTEFCTLGMLSVWLMTLLERKSWERILWPLVAGVAVAGVDEFLQTLVPDRGPALTDVVIDGLGVLMGILLFGLFAQIINLLRKRKIRNREENS